ncbi:uncharacterized protein LOC118435026 isoform X2 [Folsomia candida]|uniref:Glutamate receptor 1 n=1 Tax=Folsomia candida TaxID=158441 RepID=A0A226ELX8_FOLCA|nr:uncharacterized protein LOC118435026 isoform X2 [Folsomia candida]OXA58642.1 Glutamate receptor 1 [Folsomia candida]
MNFPQIFNLLSIIIFPSRALIITKSSPYLFHTARQVAGREKLMALVTSELINYQFKEYTLVIWRPISSPPDSFHEYDNLVTQVSQHFNSVLLFRNNSLTETSVPLPHSKLHQLSSLVLYLNLDYFLEPLQIFHTNWIAYLPGGFFNSYHLIFHNEQAPTSISQPREFSLTKLPHPLKTMVHRIFISISKQEHGYRCGLWECNIFGESCARVEMGQARSALSNKKLDMNGVPLIWATVTMSQISKKAMEDFIKYRKNLNLFITPYVEIAEIVNATPILNQVSSQNFGTLNGKSGKWEGAAGEIVYGRAHITQGLVTLDRYNALLLSKTIDTDGLIFTTGLPTASSTGSPFFLLESYDWKIWMALLITIILLVLVSTQVKQKLHFQWNNGDASRLNVSGMVMFVISPLLEQPEDTKNFRRFITVSTSKLLFGPWLLSLVVLGTMYKTSLISTMTSPTMSIPPTDFKNLLESDYRLNFLGISVTAGVVYKELKAKGSLFVKELDKRMISYYDPENGEPCITQTKGKHFACLGLRTMLTEFAILHLTKETGEPLYRFGREYLYTSFYAFCISKNLPHLLPDVDRMMLHYAESGSYAMFRRNVARYAQKFGKMAAKRRRKTINGMNHNNNSEESRTNSWNQNELDNTLRSMIVLGMGFGLATVLLGVEILTCTLSGFAIQFKVIRK